MMMCPSMLMHRGRSYKKAGQVKKSREGTRGGRLRSQREDRETLHQAALEAPVNCSTLLASSESCSVLRRGSASKT